MCPGMAGINALGLSAPADFTRKGGAQTLRPERPPQRHVGFFMKAFPRWRRGAIQA